MKKTRKPHQTLMTQFKSPGISAKGDMEINVPKLKPTNLIQMLAFEDIKELTRKYPNDQELGNHVRELIRQTQDKLNEKG